MFKTNNLFVKNFSIYFLGLAISGLISFMTIPLIVRNFGREIWNIFTRAKCYSCSYFVWGGWLNQCFAI
jgi:hypothetical protein